MICINASDKEGEDKEQKYENSYVIYVIFWHAALHYPQCALTLQNIDFNFMVQNCIS